MTRKLSAHADAVLGVSIGSDGKTFASSSADRSVIIWPAAGDAPVHVLTEHGDYVNCVKFFGHNLASCSDDRTVRLWNAETG